MLKLGEVVVVGVPFKQIAVKPDLASPEVWLECEVLLRFWKRRAYHSFTLAEAPAGEANYEINLEHLTFALSKIRYYQDLLDSRDKQ